MHGRQISYFSLKGFSLWRNILFLCITLACIPMVSYATGGDDSDPLSSAAYMYRFQKPSGEKVVGFQVPQESIKFGYEVLNKRLRVIRIVDPAPSDEELSVINKKKVTEKREELLLKTFSSSADAERARDRKIGALDVIIKITEGNIHRLNIEYETIASQAANIQKRGGSVPEELKVNMKSITRQIADADKFIDEKQSEIDDIYEDYGDDIEELKLIETRQRVSSK